MTPIEISNISFYHLKRDFIKSYLSFCSASLLYFYNLKQYDNQYKIIVKMFDDKLIEPYFNYDDFTNLKHNEYELIHPTNLLDEFQLIDNIYYHKYNHYYIENIHHKGTYLKIPKLAFDTAKKLFKEHSKYIQKEQIRQKTLFDVTV